MTSSKQVGGHPARLSRDRAPGNPFGLVEAIGGIAVGFLLSIVAVSIYVSLRGVGASSSGFGSEVVSLLLLWVGFVGAAVVATRLHDPSRAGIDPSLAGSGKLQRDFGVSIRPLVDIPLGVAVGIASQLGLIPLLELPLRPFVPNLTRQLGHPTTQLFGGVHGP
ncbi:MAG: hypothetical protein ACRDZ5_08025, partial [Acidimicrobiales bacterium]